MKFAKLNQLITEGLDRLKFTFSQIFSEPFNLFSAVPCQIVDFLKLVVIDIVTIQISCITVTP